MGQSLDVGTIKDWATINDVDDVMHVMGESCCRISATTIGRGWLACLGAALTPLALEQDGASEHAPSLAGVDAVVISSDSLRGVPWAGRRVAASHAVTSTLVGSRHLGCGLCGLRLLLGLEPGLLHRQSMASLTESLLLRTTRVTAS